MESKIIYWPNNDWCFGYELNEFMQENSLSDDYSILTAPELLWPEQVENVIVQINNGSLDPKHVTWE